MAGHGCGRARELQAAASRLANWGMEMAVHEMAIDAHPSGSADCDVETAWHPIGRAEFKLEGHVRDGGIECSIWLSAPGVGGELPQVDSVNTRAWAWHPGRPYRLRVWSPAPGSWRFSSRRCPAPPACRSNS